MADASQKRTGTALVKTKGESYFGGQKIKLDKKFYIRKQGSRKSLIIRATSGEINTATNIGLLFMKSFNIIDIINFLMKNIKEESIH